MADGITFAVVVLHVSFCPISKYRGILLGELYQHTYMSGWKPTTGNGASQKFFDYLFQETTSLSLELTKLF